MKKLPFGGKIVVIEDMLIVQKFCKVLLKKAGFEVKTFESGTEALCFISQYSKEIIGVITDNDLKDGLGSGLRVIEWLKRKTTLPYIHMSGGNEKYLAIKAQKEGYTFLSKPFKPQQLIEAVEKNFDPDRVLMN
jgi:DNA-binding NtrC family response regulator